MADFFEGFDDFKTTQPAPAKPREKFPCYKCNSTGTWRPSYGNAAPGKCHACNGRGYFATSPDARRKAREARRHRKAETLRMDAATFESEQPGLIAALRALSSWNSFARSLCEQFDARGSLSPKQIEAARRMLAKCAANDAKREAKRATDYEQVNLAPIRDAFEVAHSNGRKRPEYRGEGLLISRAPDSGKNPGALYVTLIKGGAYQGKIIGNAWMPRNAAPDTLQALQTIAADPQGVALKWGLDHGCCSVCGLELTNEKSIARGIGPVCARNWGW